MSSTPQPANVSTFGLADAEAWLDGLINRERQPRADYSRLGLEPIEALLARLGNPERELSIVHLAGSKGKGSTALLVEAVLGALGERVGVFTSPHLLRWTERFRVAGAEVGGDDLARAISRIRPHVDELRKRDRRFWPSFIDATTAAALVLFAEAGVDRAVLEVGLGGRLDSTNAVSPAVTGVTTIELEHTDKLGDTLAQIAVEKSGILKPGVPCVIGKLPREAADVVLARAVEVDAPAASLGREFGMEAEPASSETPLSTPVRFWSSDGFRFEAVVGVPGAHQIDNAALAVAAVRALGAHDDAVLAAAARRALERVVLPARIEVVERDPWVVIDSAHTRDSAATLRDVLDRLGSGRTHFVLSVSLDKQLETILDVLIPEIDRARTEGVTVTRAEPVRGRDPEEVAAVLGERRPGLPVRVVAQPEEALRSARRELPGDSTLCVAGSVYLAGIARRVLVGS